MPLFTRGCACNTVYSVVKILEGIEERLDCSGMVDWVFYNASGGDYIIGHSGGASAQHSYCTPISWDEAIPGDLVFYPGDSHVGIVGGRDEAGELLIIHCASGYNNVVITGLEGFTSIGRPRYFAD